MFRAKNRSRTARSPNVTAAYLLGIIKGRTNGNFDPDAKISREEMCTMFNNILAAADIEATEIAG